MHIQVEVEVTVTDMMHIRQSKHQITAYRPLLLVNARSSTVQGLSTVALNVKEKHQ